MLAWFLANFSAIVFYCLAAVAVAGAVGVIAFRSPVHAALSLLGSFLAVAGVFVLLHAEFLAAVQILVYAGGVMVLFLFVIMLVNVRTLTGEGQYVRRLVPAAAAGQYELTMEVRIYRERPEVARHVKPTAQALWRFLQPG